MNLVSWVAAGWVLIVPVLVMIVLCAIICVRSGVSTPVSLKDLRIGQSYRVCGTWQKGIIVHVASISHPPDHAKQCVVWEGPCPQVGQTFWLVTDREHEALVAVGFRVSENEHVDVEA